MPAKKQGKKRGRAQRDAVREQAVFAGLFAGLLGGVVFSGLLVVDNAREMRGLYQALSEVQVRQDALLEHNSRLSLERSTLSNLQTIEEVASVELDMHFPGDIRSVQR